MSKSIFEALYFGKIRPHEIVGALNPEQKKYKEKIKSEMAYFIGKMTEEDAERFNDLEDMFSCNSLDDEVNIFSNGFTLCALLMLEIIERREGFFNA